MPRQNPGEVEVVEYPYFDHLLLGVGISGLAPQTYLFNNGQTIGKPQFSNMTSAGQLPSAGVLYINSLRGFANFLSLADTEYTVAYGSIAAVTQPTSSPARMLDCYDMLGYGVQVDLRIALKPYILIPWWALPAGAGSQGFTQVAGRSIVSQGVPSRQATAFFKEPVKVDTLQAFNAICQFYTFGKAALAGQFTGSAQGGALSGDLDPQLFLNQADGRKVAGLIIGGISSRD